MVTLGYALSSEEHPPDELVANAIEAEARGFAFALISDHFHPWVERQGESPFVWSVLGAIAHETDTLEVGTGVTCPIIRTHPAIIAHATATIATMMPERFFFGVGTGENLNEHVLGDPWPSYDRRLDMLAESIDVIRSLWTGDMVTHYGDHYTVEQARLFTVPETPPPIYVAAGGEQSAAAAGRFGDGVISTSPDEAIVSTYEESENSSGPTYGMVHVCWAESHDEAVSTAHEVWPNGAMPGQLGQDMPSYFHFDQASQLVTEDDIDDAIVCGPAIDEHIEEIEAFIDAGFDHVYIHQIGPDQAGFFDAYATDVLPSFA